MSLRVLVRKDLRLEWRSRDVFAAALTVALLVALVGNVAFADRVDASRAVAGVLWTAIVFSAQVGLARSFVVERERGSLDGLLASPAAPFHIYASRLLVHTASLLLVALVAVVALWAFFRLDATPRLLAFAAVLVTGTVGVAIVTTTTSAIAMHGAHWVLLVPLLSLPLLFPVAAAAIPATDLLLQGAPSEAVFAHLRVLVSFDVIALTSAWLLVPYLLEP